MSETNAKIRSWYEVNANSTQLYNHKVPISSYANEGNEIASKQSAVHLRDSHQKHGMIRSPSILG